MTHVGLPDCKKRMDIPAVSTVAASTAIIRDGPRVDRVAVLPAQHVHRQRRISGSSVAALSPVVRRASFW